MKLLIALGLMLAAVSCLTVTHAEKSAGCLQRHSMNGDGVIACMAYIPSWSYNSASDECVKFIYGGCGGNANRFVSEQECEEACKN